MKQPKVIVHETMALNAEILGWLTEQAVLDLSACNTFFRKKDIEKYIVSGLRDLIIIPTEDKIEEKAVLKEIAGYLTDITVSVLPNIEKKDGEVVYTTDALVAAESDIHRAGADMTGTKDAISDKKGLLKSLESYFIADNIRDDDELRVVMPKIVTDNRRLIIVDAPPGSGKSKIFQGFSYTFYHHSHDSPLIIATSPSDQAAVELYHDLTRKLSLVGTDFKLKQYNLRLLLADLKDAEFPKDTVIMVDEAGFIGTKDMASLLKEASKQELKVIMVGDSKQIPPLPAGNGFSLISKIMIKDKKASVYNIESIFRQKDVSEKQATKDIRSGNADLALAFYNERVYPDGNRALNFMDNATEKAIDDYVKYIGDPYNSDKNATVLAVDGLSAREINSRMQPYLVDAEMIRNPVTYEFKSKTIDFYEADRVIFYQKCKAVENGKDLIVNAGIRGEIVETSETGLQVRISDNHIVFVPKDECRNLEKAWCLSMYVAQGISQFRSFLIINKKGKMDLAQGLVAFSRHKKQISAYIETSAYKDVKELGREMKVFKSSPIISEYVDPTKLGYNTKDSFSEKITKIIEKRFA